jgi:hypothetical protein
MTQSDWESIGALIGLFMLVITAFWILSDWDDFDGGW